MILVVDRFLWLTASFSIRFEFIGCKNKTNINIISKQNNAKRKNEIEYKQKHIQEQINDNMEANKNIFKMITL